MVALARGAGLSVWANLQTRISHDAGERGVFGVNLRVRMISRKDVSLVVYDVLCKKRRLPLPPPQTEKYNNRRLLERKYESERGDDASMTTA